MPGLGQIIREIGMWVPWPVLVVLAVVAVAVGAPGYLHAIRLRQVRERVRRRVRADEAQRARLADDAMRVAGHDVDALALLCREAARRGQPDLLQRAMAALEATGDARALKRVHAEIRRPTPIERSPTEVAVFISGLLDEGLNDVARKHLDEALRAYPEHPALTTLATRLTPPVEPGATP